jgi:hypothetical protein
MNEHPIDFTTLVGLDVEHVEELRLTWPTWVRFRPEILQHPMICVCDGALSEDHWHTALSFVDHPDKSIVVWYQPDVSQRAKMLTALTLAPAAWVSTPWYLKLDTDAVACTSDDWIQDEWFAPNIDGQLPAFVTNPWGYTKPADAIVRLDDWADQVPAMKNKPRLNLVPTPGASLISHRRIISWCFFGNTQWTRTVTSYCDGRLPVPSQDTYLWYCAARRGDFYRTVRMKHVGWQHIGRRRRLAQVCREVMSQELETHET